MKKRVIALMICMILINSAFYGTVYASSPIIKVFINNTELKIPSNYGTPFYDNNQRLQIPMRFIIESCGYEVIWYSDSQTAIIPTEKGDVVVSIGSNILKVGTHEIKMDTTAQVKDGRTYIPLRFALEALGFNISWSQESNFDKISINGINGQYKLKQPLTSQQISETASPAIFYIEVYQGDTPIGSGSGFFIEKSGVAITNYHVIKNTTNAIIQTIDGEAYPVLKILCYDEEKDFAFIKVSNTSIKGRTINEFPWLKIGDSDIVKNGQNIYTIGSPRGLQNTISDGLISNAKRTFSDIDMSFIQITAPISPGSSGGALINEYAEVIGITSIGYDYAQNLNLAVPINYIKNIAFPSDGIPYAQVYIKEFKNSLEDKTENFKTEIEQPVITIKSNDLFSGTFYIPLDQDIYTFYIPTPVYATVACSGYGLLNTDKNLDAYYLKNYGMTYDNYIFSSLDTILFSQDKSMQLRGNLQLNYHNCYYRRFDKVLLPAGRYYILVKQNLGENATVWQSRAYYLKLVLDILD